MQLRVYASFIILALTAWLDHTWHNAWNWSPELIFASLVVFAFFLNVWEFIPLLLWGMWLFAWPLFMGWEVPVMGLLLVIFFFGSRRLPWRPWFNAEVLILFGIILLALLFNPGFILARTSLFMTDLSISFIFGIVLFWFLHRVLRYPIRTAGPLPQRLPIFLP